MSAFVKKIKSVRGFMPTTYAVYQGESPGLTYRLIGLYEDKTKAEQHADRVNMKENMGKKTERK